MGTGLRVFRTAVDQLSIREEQILRLAANGLLDKQIASELSVTENTLRTYWRRIRLKLGEAPRSALAAHYIKGRSVEDFQDRGAWTLDVERKIVDYHGDREILPRGEISLEEALTSFHADDRERMADLIQTLSRIDAPPITVMVRVITPQGVQVVTTRLECVRDNQGKVIQIVGKPVPILDLTLTPERRAHFGVYRRDLISGAVDIDDGFREIYRIGIGERNIREAVLERYCPASRDKMSGMVEGMVESGPGRRRWTACLCFSDGEKLRVSGQSYLEEQAGRPTAFVGVVVAFY
ncbi:hypothetical protein EON82_17010 [bacterium]|nr:MAG: hypothetical protein EON82_17010 [bacterium]